MAILQTRRWRCGCWHQGVLHERVFKDDGSANGDDLGGNGLLSAAIALTRNDRTEACVITWAEARGNQGVGQLLGYDERVGRKNRLKFCPFIIRR
jgi:hypothetical protein